MNEVELKKLWDKLQGKLNVGDFESFKSKMSTNEKRKVFFDKYNETLKNEYKLSLGNYNDFEMRLSGGQNDTTTRFKVITSVFCGVKDGKITSGVFKGQPWSNYKKAYNVTNQEETVANKRCPNVKVTKTAEQIKTITSVFCGVKDGKITGGSFAGQPWNTYKVRYSVTDEEEANAKKSCPNVVTSIPQNTNPAPDNSNRKITYTDCPEELPIKKHCRNNTVKKLQACLNMPKEYQTGNFGPITQRYLESLGLSGTKITANTLYFACREQLGQSGAEVEKGVVSQSGEVSQTTSNDMTSADYYNDYQTDEVETDYSGYSSEEGETLNTRKPVTPPVTTDQELNLTNRKNSVFK